jgi:hypothetical protein
MRVTFGLRAKLALTLSAFGLLPLVVVGVIAARAVRGVRAQAAASLQNVAENVADKMDRNLFERYGDAQAFGFNNAALDTAGWYGRDTSATSLVRRMDQYVDAYDLYYLTMMVDAAGRVVAVNSRDADGKPLDTRPLYAKRFADAAWFRACTARAFTRKMQFTAPGNDVADGTFVEDLHVDADVRAAYPGDDARTIGFTAPVYRDGRVVGCWRNAAKFSAMRAIVATAYDEMKAKGYPGASLTLLDSAGAVLLAFDPSARRPAVPNAAAGTPTSPAPRSRAAAAAARRGAGARRARGAGRGLHAPARRDGLSRG